MLVTLHINCVLVVTLLVDVDAGAASGLPMDLQLCSAATVKVIFVLTFALRGQSSGMARGAKQRGVQAMQCVCMRYKL